MASCCANCGRRAFGIMVGIFYAVVVLGELLVQFFRKGRRLCRVMKRDTKPDCLSDPTFGEHCFIKLEDIRLHYVVAGAPNKPLMLFVHGFPEFWYSWRYQLREFQKDYRVVAIDQRGYNESDAPAGVDNYAVDKMVNDLKRLIPALGYEKCVLVGHDWGGVICWAFAYRFPNLIDRLVILNAPHPLVFREYMRSHWTQFRKSWYTFLFQLPYLPEFWMRNSDMARLDEFFLSKAFGVQTGIMTKEDVEAYKYAFSLKGFTAPINYYRAAFGAPSSSRTGPSPKSLDMPVLTVWGNKDAAIETEIAHLTAKHVPNYTLKIVDGASHWVQMDQPEVVNNHIHDFLKAKL